MTSITELRAPLARNRKRKKQPTSVVAVPKATTINAPHRMATARTSGNNSVVMHAEAYSGPVVHPSIADGWEAVVPGSAGRILTMAENQSSHRQSMESRVVRTRNLSQILGTVFAGTFALAGLYAGYLLIMADKPATGLTAMLTPLGVIVGAFLKTSADTKKQ